MTISVGNPASLVRLYFSRWEPVKTSLGWYRPGVGNFPRMVPTRGRAPPHFLPPSMTATVINHARNRDRRASTAATVRRIVPSNLGPLLEGHGVFWRAGRGPG